MKRVVHRLCGSAEVRVGERNVGERAVGSARLLNVAAGGRIAFPKGSRQYAEQARRLRAEGVDVVCGRVLASAEPDLDELLWKPK